MNGETKLRIKEINLGFEKLRVYEVMDNDKVICRFINVTAQDLKDAIKNGAKSFEEVQEITKAGTGYGNCVDGVKILVDELLQK